MLATSTISGNSSIRSTIAIEAKIRDWKPNPRIEDDDNSILSSLVPLSFSYNSLEEQHYFLFDF